MKKAIQILKSSELNWWKTYKRDIGIAFGINHHHDHHHHGGEKCSGNLTQHQMNRQNLEE